MININEKHEVAQNCVCFNLRKATRAVTKAYDTALEPCDLRVTQFSILIGLSLAKRFSINQFADAMATDRTTLTRNLQLLNRRKLVRFESGADRRERFISLTEAGLEALAKALPLWKKVQAQTLLRIGSNEWNSLRNGLAAFISNKA